jgi:hypothetical protein
MAPSMIMTSPTAARGVSQDRMFVSAGKAAQPGGQFRHVSHLRAGGRGIRQHHPRM